MPVSREDASHEFSAVRLRQAFSNIVCSSGRAIRDFDVIVTTFVVATLAAAMALASTPSCVVLSIAIGARIPWAKFVAGFPPESAVRTWVAARRRELAAAPLPAAAVQPEGPDADVLCEIPSGARLRPTKPGEKVQKASLRKRFSVWQLLTAVGFNQHLKQASLFGDAIQDSNEYVHAESDDDSDGLRERPPN